MTSERHSRVESCVPYLHQACVPKKISRPYILFESCVPYLCQPCFHKKISRVHINCLLAHGVQ